MKKGVVLFLLLLFSLPLAFSISIKELVSRYTFSTMSSQVNIMNYTDYMIDKDINGINDTLIIELAINNSYGNFVFVLNLYDDNNVLINETQKALNAGINQLNISFASIYFSQNQFNYSIKVYNSSYGLKYRKDDIPTQFYQNYEHGFEILGISDTKNDKTLKINITINSSVNSTFETVLFLNYNGSAISIKSNKSIINSIQDLFFDIDNETIKRTHFAGNFNVTSLKIGKKILKLNYLTDFYDFRDFASSSYIDSFDDKLIDADSNGIYDSLEIVATLNIESTNEYWLVLGLYDLFDNLIEIRNVSSLLSQGNQAVSLSINGSRIYSRKLNGPYTVRYATLFENGAVIDHLNDAFTTNYYNFDNFSNSKLPDLLADIKTSDEYHYGINNATVNVTIKNIGSKNAFNVFVEIFDNNSLSISNITNIIGPNSIKTYQFNFTNFSDFEIMAIADLNDFVEELNESNNAERIAVELNHKPVIEQVDNITVNATNKIIINASAFDFDSDELFYSINNSNFLHNNNIFEWSTTSNDTGSHAYEATVSDGFLNDSALFRITILDVQNDLDLDGIDDMVDNLILNNNSIKTSTLSLLVAVNGSKDLTKIFSGNLLVKFLDKNLTVTEFNFNFSRYRLNLTNVTVNKQSNNSKGLVYISGLKLPHNNKKTMYLDRLNKKLSSVCIKDDFISSASDISKKCKAKNEVKLKCNGRLNKKYGYRCTYNSTTKKYKVQGLNHSAIMQI